VSVRLSETKRKQDAFKIDPVHLDNVSRGRGGGTKSCEIIAFFGGVQLVSTSFNE
jgi:hypothetical protein